eukprot:CAMPEP_0203684910 /NCGR_PEP_ID=MMETSP0090-20130426/48275_1 /ASSEMBLY_ACC=CAM_ASM_001088 /TAXON_ID=426623 /ORGANISM="Chaetoceros affinis, Strain CCMP159" /LENGTH=983 /DNA_ID=CAMNT_0050554091 /DNA_START=64 /DNA_END=3018 /DNA_ORIENTATION=-
MVDEDNHTTDGNGNDSGSAGTGAGTGSSNDANPKAEEETLNTFNTNTHDTHESSSNSSSNRDLNKNVNTDNNGNVTSDLVWDEEEEYNNNDDDLSYEEEHNDDDGDDDDDDDDDLSFKSAKTSHTNGNSNNSNGVMYSSSLEESFITYAHDSIISIQLPPQKQKQKQRQKQRQKHKDRSPRSNDRPRPRLSPSLIPPHLLGTASSASKEQQQQQLGEVILEEETEMGEIIGGDEGAKNLTESFDEISYDSSSAYSSSSSFVDALSEDEEDYDGDGDYNEYYNGTKEGSEKVDQPSNSSSNNNSNSNSNDNIRSNSNHKMSNSASTEIMANNDADTSSGTCTTQTRSHPHDTTTNKNNIMKQENQSTSNSTRNSSITGTNTSTKSITKTNQTAPTHYHIQYHQRQRPKIHSFTFNQDKNCIAIATSTGYRIRTLPLSTFVPLQPQNYNSNSEKKDEEDQQHQQQQGAAAGGSFSNHVKIHQVIYPPPVSKSSPSKLLINNSMNSNNNNNNDSSSSNRSSNTGVSHIQIMHSTSVLFIVKKQTPRLLSIVHAKTAQLILDIPFTNAIRRIEANIASLVVLTADGLLHVFSLKVGSGSSDNAGGGGKHSELQMKQQKKGIQFLKTIEILHSTESTRMMTAENAKTQGAFFDLSSHLFTTTAEDTSSAKTKAKMGNDGRGSSSGSDGASWLVTKSNEGVGYVSVFKSSTKVIYVTKEQKGPKGGVDVAAGGSTNTKRKPMIQKKKKDCMELIHTFQAHDHGIARIAIGGASDVHLKQKVFATVSLKGTVIRVFNLPSCSKLYEFHRGTSPCTMFSLSFNFDASMIASSSSRGTVHVFQLTEESRIKEHNGMSSYIHDDSHSAGWRAEAGTIRSSSSKQRWYDNILSSIKKTNKEDDSKIQIVRSIAKIKCEKPVVPNTIAILPKRRTVKMIGLNTGEENDDDEYVAICFENGKLLVYAVRKNPSMIVRPRPVLADDIMFDSESALAS